MTSWQKDMPADKSIEHFIRTLQERPQIMALARNPLLLTMVAYLYTDTEFALPHSRSEFYSRSTDLLLDQWKLDRNLYKVTHKRIVLQKLALFNQTQSGKTGERRTIELADVLKEVRDVLPDLTLKTEDSQSILDEIVQRSGLMLAIDGGTRYQFTHLTLQEYFAARALGSDQKKLLKYYHAAPDAWREVVRLWCALEHDSTSMLKELYVLDPVMAFECLSDAQQVDNVYANELIQSFQPRLHEALTNDLLASAFALLAANQNSPRGKKWFEFVKSNLNDEHNRLAACAVLARTNISQAAKPLVDLAATESDVIPFLVQLGNLVVPTLIEPVQKGEIWAMDVLVDIGTPKAALALQPLLWTGELKAYHVAWRLAALLPFSGVESALQTVTLTSEQQKAERINWIWDPFSNSVTLRSIAGRIAYLVHTTSKEDALPIYLPCDGRLALALCAIVAQGTQLEKFERRNLDATTLKSIVTSPAMLSKHPVWMHLYSTLSTEKQFDLMHLLVSKEKRLPSIDDWRNLFKPVSYDFSKSWHIKVLKLLLFILVFLNLWEMALEISRPPILLTWETAGMAFLDVTLLIGMILSQRMSWTLRNWEAILFFTFCGLGVAFGTITGGLISNWIFQFGVGLLSGMVGMVGVAGVTGVITKIFTGADDDVVVSSVVIGFWGGIVGSILGVVGVGIGSAIGTIIGGFSFSSIVDNFGRLGNLIGGVIVIGITIGAILGIGIAGGDILGIGVGVVIGYFSYLVTNLLYGWAGPPAALLFWCIWLVTFMFVYLIVKRQQRRAQNPLHGLFEPSGEVVSSRHSPSLLRRWFWIQ